MQLRWPDADAKRHKLTISHRIASTDTDDSADKYTSPNQYARSDEHACINTVSDRDIRDHGL